MARGDGGNRGERSRRGCKGRGTVVELLQRLAVVLKLLFSFQLEAECLEDRREVDAWEEPLRSFATTRPDNPFTETGVRSEFTHHGLSSRLGQKRTDLIHQPLDPVLVAGPWVAAVAGVAWLGRRLARSRR